MSAIEVSVKLSSQVHLQDVPFGSAFLCNGDMHLLICSSKNRARAGEMQVVRFWKGRDPEEWFLSCSTLVTVVPSSIEFTV